MFEEDELDTPLVDLDNRFDSEMDEPLNNPDEPSEDYQDDMDSSDELDMPLNGADDYSGEKDSGDPNFQGIIRTVKGAALVYKRKTPEDTYEELWIFNVGKDMKQESIIRRAILAGTDIDPSSGTSEDGSQTSSSYTVGNVQFLQLDNIDN